jgi:hypothetical protein
LEQGLGLGGSLMQHQNLQLAAVVKLPFGYLYFDSDFFTFPCLFCGFSFHIPTQLPVFVTGVFCCEIFSACVTGDMMYCDFKAATNLTNMQTLGCYGLFSCLEFICSGIGVL